MNRTFLAWCRTIHIYLTMFGLVVMLFFGVTGFTVNHEEWFGATVPRTTSAEGKTPLELIQKKDALHIVEHLRSSFHIIGAMTAYDDLDDKLSIGFKSPDQLWQADIVKSSGLTTVSCDSFNAFALINNLHRGRYSGAAWKWVIDITAGLIVLACATGIVLWLALPKRRQLGIAALVMGTIGIILIYLIWVPGADQPAITDTDQHDLHSASP